jgi:hypothetical protein
LNYGREERYLKASGPKNCHGGLCCVLLVIDILFSLALLGLEVHIFGMIKENRIISYIGQDSSIERAFRIRLNPPCQ